MGAITLTTDFGLGDWFVGTMKAVILGIHPRANVVDITHEIPPGDIRAGAFALMAGCRYFPNGTVHLAVVDPGVGGRRQAVAVRTASSFFVGPDNGVLSWALALEKIETIRLLENRQYFLEPVSRTFHGPGNCGQRRFCRTAVRIENRRQGDRKDEPGINQTFSVLR
ncbi:MAG TPA: SAM-dependent chlorinase/fluorinase [Dongiaceae bacterium]|nr:SAM-dependent chlorinase/fluorinase [Dongiaceae bacterium]